MKERYRELCNEESSIPLFSQAWWLDAVAGDSWDVILEMKGDQIIGALPYVVQKKLGIKFISQPKLTQSLGPWIRPTQKSYSKQLSYEKDVLNALNDNLPACDEYRQNWYCGITNWLPFYWNGYEQTTRYTYRLDLTVDKDLLWKGLQQNIRGDIRKAQERFRITVRKGTIQEFIELNRLTFERQGRSAPYTKELVDNINIAALKRNACDCLIAEDEEGRLHAGAYIVRSCDTAYYLMGGGDPELRNSGATSLVLWEAICRQPEEIEIFDFEGSMIEPIERFFRAFGAVQAPYYHVSKTFSKFLRFARFWKGLIK
ncbi:MAG: GNAT family N-acetyltransferase [Idiomarina sp.]